MYKTPEEFNKFLVAFTEHINDKEFHEVRTLCISLVLTGNLWKSKRYNQIPNYMKWSLARKVARYIAITALKGVDKINDLAVEIGFHECIDGKPVPFDSYVKK